MLRRPPPSKPEHRGGGSLAAAALVVVTFLAFGVLAVGSALGLDLDVSGSGPPPPHVVAHRHRRERRSSPLPQLALTIGAQEPLTSIPRSFLGFSTEYWTLPVDERHIMLYRRVISLVHVPGDGRFVLRIGGDSSDHALWEPGVRHLPHWAFPLTARWMSRTARVVRDSGLRVIIDLNFITGSPKLAAAWARHAERELPRHSIIGFEVGNEPDLYVRNLWTLELGHGAAAGLLPRTITPLTYVGAYGAYERALAAVAPGVPLLAPALAEPRRDRTWIQTLVQSPHPHLGTISVHMYPYTACARPRAGNYPTVARLLSRHAMTEMETAVAPAVALARQESLPVRVTEFNSVACGGLQGVSNTFATALWAPDALFELAHAGVTAADLHVRVFSVNAPFWFDARGIQARPLLYGLILFRRMLGPDSRLVPVRLQGASSSYVTAWAVRHAGGRLNLLLVDRGKRSVRVRLRLPSSGPASVQRLLAPTPASTSGITLDGQHLDADARWRGRRVTQTVASLAGRYTVVVPGYSAALITVRVADDTLTG